MILRAQVTPPRRPPRGLNRNVPTSATIDWLGKAAAHFIEETLDTTRLVPSARARIPVGGEFGSVDDAAGIERTRHGFEVRVYLADRITVRTRLKGGISDAGGERTGRGIDLRDRCTLIGGQQPQRRRRIKIGLGRGPCTEQHRWRKFDGKPQTASSDDLQRGAPEGSENLEEGGPLESRGGSHSPNSARPHVDHHVTSGPVSGIRESSPDAMPTWPYFVSRRPVRRHRPHASAVDEYHVTMADILYDVASRNPDHGTRHRDEPTGPSRRDSGVERRARNSVAGATWASES